MACRSGKFDLLFRVPNLIPLEVSVFKKYILGVMAVLAASVFPLAGETLVRGAAGQGSDLFTGAPVKFEVEVFHTPGQDGELRCRVFQIGGAIGAPINGVVNPGTMPVEARENLARNMEFTVNLPEVGQRIDYALKFEARSGGDWESAGMIRIAGYPPGALDALRGQARRDLEIFVAGESGNLRTALRDLDLSATDLGLSLDRAPSGPGIILVEAGERKIPPPALQAGQVLIVFDEPGDTLPMVKISPLGNGMLIQSSLGLPSRLGANPRARQTFLELIQQAGKSNPTLLKP